jgi:transposase
MISEITKQQIFELRKQGKGVLEISIILKLGKATVYEWCKRFDPNGEYNLTNKIKEIDKENIINQYKQGLSLKQVNIIYSNFSKASIRDILIKEGIYIKKIKYDDVSKKKAKSKNVINWKKDKKKKLVEYKGGKCQICGYNKCEQALDFHHIDASQKDFDISSNSFSFDKMKKEADKCALLCANCHREIHAGLITLN